MDLDKLIEHFMKVNNVDRESFENHESEAFSVWRRRSLHEWTTELGGYKELLKKVDKEKSKIQ